MAKETKQKSFFAKRKKIIFAAIVIAAIALIFLFVSKRRNADVETFKIERGEVAEELILSGEVMADEHAQLTFQSPGEITWIGVKEGEEVKKGQALGKLDTISLNADYQRALSDLRSADASVEKAHDDVKDHTGDETFAQKETRTAAEVAKDKAYENVIKTQKALKNATLYSPFAGIVTHVQNPYSGVSVLSTQTQFEIVNPETIYFEVTADQTEVYILSIGQEVKIVLDAFPEDTYTAKVYYISYTPKTDEVGTVYKIKVIFSESGINAEKIRIGMSGDAKFILSKKDDVLYAPNKFVNSDAKGKYVNVGSPKNKIYIEVGLEGEEKVEITGDIKEGQTLYD